MEAGKGRQCTTHNKDPIRAVRIRRQPRQTRTAVDNTHLSLCLRLRWREMEERTAKC